jgi:cytochrome c5
MKFRKSLATTAALVALAASLSAQAYEADWKRGRVYYRSVCTACHTASPIGAINPSSRTKAEWAAYLQADKHAKGKDTVKEYVEDTKAFLIKGAKDGDAPASCG